MILVTGAMGFIGSALVAKLNALGRRDIVVTDYPGTDERWKNLRGLSFRDFIHADDTERIEKGDWEQIIHLGANAKTTERNMEILMKTNVLYSQNIFRLCTRRRIPLIYASSAATYGDGAKGFNDDHTGVEKLSALNPYAYSKQLFDLWVLGQERVPPVWFGLKFFNVFGPGEYHKGEMRSLVHKAFCQIGETGRVKLFKSCRKGTAHGWQKRDFIYIKDAVSVLTRLMPLRKGSGLYNLGTGVARSFYDLVAQTFRAMGREIQIDYIEMPDAVREHYQYFTEANMTKLKSLLPGLTFPPLEDSVDNFVREHLMVNESCWRPSR